MFWPDPVTVSAAGAVRLPSTSMTTDLRKSPAPVPVKPRAARLFERDPDVSPWLFWPARIAAVVVMLPVVLAWELVGVIRRGVRRFVLEPLRVLLYHLVIVPLRAAGRALGWVGRRALVALAWLGHHLIVV